MNILLVYPDPLKKGSEKLQKITDADDARSFFTPAFKPNLTLLTLASLTPEEHSVHILDDGYFPENLV